MARTRKCILCGAHVNRAALTVPENKKGANSSVGWVCEDCAAQQNYSYKVSSTGTGAKAHKPGAILTGLEVEYMFNFDSNYNVVSPYFDEYGLTASKASIRAFLAKTWRGVDTYDGSVDGEVKFSPRASLSGLREMFTQTAKCVNLSHSACGLHANISVNGWEHLMSFRDNAYLRRVIWNFGEWLEQQPVSMVEEVFGRGFTYYAALLPDVTEHESFIRLRHNNVVEWRILHFRDVAQVMRGLDFIHRATRHMDSLAHGFISTEDCLKKWKADFQKAASHSFPVDSRSIRDKDGNKVKG